MSPCPRAPEPQGTIHPVSQVLDEVIAIFADLGFAVAEGPDVEYRRLQFHQAEHPARSSGAADAGHVLCAPQADGSRHVLRTHTSPVQVRTMLKQKPPIRIISPGRTYRVDSDATHSPMFHQFEGLVIDEGHQSRPSEMDAGRILQGVLRSGQGRTARAAIFFPFTEPSRGMGHALRPLGAGQDHIRHRQ